ISKSNVTFANNSPELGGLTDFSPNVSFCGQIEPCSSTPPLTAASFAEIAARISPTEASNTAPAATTHKKAVQE
ncbi:hypothetical protein, partial [Paenibacillus anseongensis]|uniref:hypothetical protein n=1 Tax=Paenibacillus sp. CGMCC 1.16610 TaxID=2755557 RepID=UPI001C6697B0